MASAGLLVANLINESSTSTVDVLNVVVVPLIVKSPVIVAFPSTERLLENVASPSTKRVLVNLPVPVTSNL